MKVISKNPVTINGKRVSAPSKYIPANGMGEYETTLKSTSSPDNFYGANGKGEFETTMESVVSKDNFYGANGMGEYETTLKSTSSKDNFYGADGDFFSANGMGEFETTLASTSSPDNFYGFDASKPSQVKAFQDWMDIKYPGWVPLKDGKLNKNVSKGYGKYGPSTQKADKTYGAEFTKGAAALLNTLGGALTASGGGASPADTTPSTTPTPEVIAAAKKKGVFWDKAKGWIQKGKDTGFFESLKAKFSPAPAAGAPTDTSGTPTDTTPVDTSATDATPPPGMSKGMKIGIAVGAVVLLGVIIYAVTRPKKAGK